MPPPGRNATNREVESDPYGVLGVPFDAAVSEIKTAYRKLALRLHPDKNRNLSAAEAAAVALKFEAVRDAHSFLTSDDRRAEREAYVSRRRATETRKKHDAARSSAMDERRRRMREDLERGEAAAMRAGSALARRREKDAAENLRREGRRMREEAAVAERSVEERARRDREAVAARKVRVAAAAAERRQARVKWRSAERFTDVSLAEELERKLADSVVKSVKMEPSVPGRGGQALVTFVNEEYVALCVKKYSEHGTVRAFYVGKRKREAEAEELKKIFGKRRQAASASPPIPGGVRRQAKVETEEKATRRRELEREKIIRQMEREDASGSDVSAHGNVDTDVEGSLDIGEEDIDNAQYPPPFFFNEPGLNPLERLEKLEKIVLPLCLAENEIKF